VTLENDRYYTPTWLADELSRLLPRRTRSVVDLAAGSGSLLEAACRRFGEVSVGAADVDPEAVRHLRKVHPDWTTSCANSLSPASYRASAAFRQFPNSYDVAILNPPFSYRGGTRITLRHSGIDFKVTPATAFMAHALDWIGPNGTIVAIVPKNVMDIRTDVDLWQVWRSHHRIDRIRELGRHTFQNARTTAMVVVLRKSDRRNRSSRGNGVGVSRILPTTIGRGCKCVEVVRGRVPVYRSESLRGDEDVAFVHTTMLQQGALRLTDALGPKELASVGPMTLLPRVGKPTSSKVVRSSLPLAVLSDCVLGVRALNPRMQGAVHRVLIDEFDDLVNCYTGSCAPYLTVDRLLGWLGARGFYASHVAPSSNPGWCGCSALDAELA
jgi:predicted RNA methylase